MHPIHRAIPAHPAPRAKRKRAATHTALPQPPVARHTLGLTAPPAVPGIVGTPGSNPVHVRILGVNDLHGQIGDSDAKIGAINIGGSATLAGYINKERNENPNGTVLLSVGDAFGASPPESSLLNHESTLAVMTAMGFNMATLGNHEFDRGYEELMRLIRGGKKTVSVKKGKKTVQVPEKGPAWPGTPFPWLSANILDKKTGKPILPPYVIMEVNGVKVAFIGAVTGNIRNVTMAAALTKLDILDPADAINKYIPEIQAQGVHAIVAFMHEGGEKNAKGEMEGAIVDISNRLDADVDAVMSAHSHREYSTRINGKLVTQGLSYAKALSEIDLAIDPKTGQVVAGSSRIIKNDENAITPDPLVKQVADAFVAAVAPKTQAVISNLPGPILRTKSLAGESALGSLIAEAQRRFAGAQIGIMNPGGVRQDLTKGGPVTWGTLFGVQPFNNHVHKATMTGKQIMVMLEEMFHAEGKGDSIMLQLAGMRVWFDMRKPVGHRIVKVITDDGKPLNMKKQYTVSMNEFLAQGGDGFHSLGKIKGKKDMGTDLDALVKYLAAGLPVPTKPIGRLNIVGGTLPAGAH